MFFYNNQTTTITVNQTHNVILLTLKQTKIPNIKYTPLQIKQNVNNYKKTNKKQIQQIIKTLLKLKKIPKPDDTTDTLTITITHINHL